MTNERHFHGQPQIDYFYRPTEKKLEMYEGQITSTTTGMESQQKNNLAAELPLDPVMKVLDSLRIEPRATRHALNTNGVLATHDLTALRGSRDGYSLRFDASSSHSRTGNDLPVVKSYLNSATDDSTDAESTQSSELSSEIRSLNTTSTESENRPIKQQIVKASRDSRSTKFNTITVRTSNGFIIDLDVEVTRTVVMLMKIILWLRQRYLGGKSLCYRQAKLSPGAIVPFPDSSSDESFSSQDTIILNTKPKRKRISFSPNTLLISAVTDKSFSEAQEILANNDIDVNQQTPSGQSLLHIAAGNADLKCTRLLLEYGADANIMDQDGWGPLHSAIRRGNWKCAILLIESGADFAEYSQRRIREYKDVLQKSKSCYKSMEIFV
ncbi:probable serine/threonine-protein kinase DDB_G0278535 [Nematostella vectensis]|nr:probable serine/threonine-protein kinase DDB_G0278535 [Nematostella vectensis]